MGHFSSVGRGAKATRADYTGQFMGNGCYRYRNLLHCDRLRCRQPGALSGADFLQLCCIRVLLDFHHRCFTREATRDAAAAASGVVSLVTAKREPSEVQ